MLLAYGQVLLGVRVRGSAGIAPLFAGVFEYFSLRPHAFDSVSWGRTRVEATTNAQSQRYNCSPSGGGWHFDGWYVRMVPVVSFGRVNCTEAALA